MFSWKRSALIFACVILGVFLDPIRADELANGGRTKFEIFGMMDEYGLWFAGFDGETIDRFD